MCKDCADVRQKERAEKKQRALSHAMDMKKREIEHLEKLESTLREV